MENLNLKIVQAIEILLKEHKFQEIDNVMQSRTTQWKSFEFHPFLISVFDDEVKKDQLNLPIIKYIVKEIAKAMYTPLKHTIYFMAVRSTHWSQLSELFENFRIPDFYVYN